MLFNKKGLLVLNNATAHLAIVFPIRCSYKLLSKSFLIDLIIVTLDNFTLGIMTSVSNFEKCQMTHSFKRESEADPEVE